MDLSEQNIQVHKFVKDAHDMLGTIDNLVREDVSIDRTAEALPDLGTVGEMAQRLREKLAVFTKSIAH